MRRHAPVFSKNRGTTREPELFDKLNHLLTPRLGGAVKRHRDYVQKTVLGPGTHLTRDIAVAKIDRVVGELSCRAFGHSMPSSKRATAFSSNNQNSALVSTLAKADLLLPTQTDKNCPSLRSKTPTHPAQAAPKHRETKPAQKPQKSQS